MIAIKFQSDKNTFEYNKRRQIVPTLKQYLEIIGTKPNRLVLSILA